GAGKREPALVHEPGAAVVLLDCPLGPRRFVGRQQTRRSIEGRCARSPACVATRNTHSRVRANALQLAAPGLTSEVDASVFDPEPHRSRDRRAVTPETDDQAVVRAVERVDRTERLALGDGTGLGLHGAP